MQAQVQRGGLAPAVRAAGAQAPLALSSSSRELALRHRAPGSTARQGQVDGRLGSEGRVSPKAGPDVSPQLFVASRTARPLLGQRGPF